MCYCGLDFIFFKQFIYWGFGFLSYGVNMVEFLRQVGVRCDFSGWYLFIEKIYFWKELMKIFRDWVDFYKNGLL